MRSTTMALVWAMVAGCETLRGADGAPGEPGPAGEQGIQGDQGDQGEQGIQGEAGDPGIVDPSLCHLVIQENTNSTAVASCDETTEFLLYGGCYTAGNPTTTSVPGVDEQPPPGVPFSWYCVGTGNFTRAYAFCCPLP